MRIIVKVCVREKGCCVAYTTYWDCPNIMYVRFLFFLCENSRENCLLLESFLFNIWFSAIVVLRYIVCARSFSINNKSFLLSRRHVLNADVSLCVSCVLTQNWRWCRSWNNICDISTIIQTDQCALSGYRFSSLTVTIT